MTNLQHQIWQQEILSWREWTRTVPSSLRVCQSGLSCSVKQFSDWMCVFIGYNSLFSAGPMKRISCKLFKDAFDTNLGYRQPALSHTWLYEKWCTSMHEQVRTCVWSMYRVRCKMECLIFERNLVIHERYSNCMYTLIIYRGKVTEGNVRCPGECSALTVTSMYFLRPPTPTCDFRSSNRTSAVPACDLVAMATEQGDTGMS